jgi:hypothetical protein
MELVPKGNKVLLQVSTLFTEEVAMKTMACLSGVAAAVLLATANMASAVTLGMNVGLEYVESYNSLGDVVPLVTHRSLQGDGSTKTVVPVASGAVSHKFNLYLSMHDLAADQDFVICELDKYSTGAVTAEPFASYEPNSYMINPSKMPSGTGSDAPNATWDNQNFFNGYAAVVEVRRGTSQTGAGNGTYGDYPAYLQLGESSPFLVGSLTLGATDAGTFGFQLKSNPNYFKIISGNTTGLGVEANESYPTYTGHSDSIEFIPAPEPGALALLATMFVSLVVYAWRRRKCVPS